MLALKTLCVVLFVASVAQAADRIYTANEVSNSVSVVDPATNTLLGNIVLGRFRSTSFGSYTSTESQINVHGITASPDKKTLAVISNVTNSVVLVDVPTAKPIKVIYVGRSPHTATFTPDGKELWVNNRGQSTISIIDTKKRIEKLKLATEKSPSHILFLKNKPYAIVCFAWSDKIQVFNYKSKKLVSSIKTNSNFSPVMELSPDEKEVWIVQKDRDSVARLNINSLKIVETFYTGPYTQHPQFFIKDGKTYGLVTVGGDNALKVYTFSSEGKVNLFKSVEVEGVPHGIVSSPDGTKLYVALEHGDKLIVIDTNTFTIVKKIPVGNSPQGIVYIKDALIEGSTIKEKNLELPKIDIESRAIQLGHNDRPKSKGSVVLREHDQMFFITHHLYNVETPINLKIFATASKENYTKIPKNDLILIGYLICNESFVCSSESNLPQNSVLRDVFEKSGQVFFVNDKTDLVFMKGERNQ